MLFIFRRRQSKTAPPPASPALTRIHADASALRLPSGADYSAAHQEALQTLQAELFKLHAAIEEARTAAFAAAVTLMSLNAPAPTQLNAYTELIAGPEDHHGKTV